MTPKGIRLYLDVEDILRTKDKVRCAIRKDAGDDPDVTDQILVYAEVSKTEGKQITLDGGVGVGRITRKGLEQDIGDAAINKVPRAMIREAVEKRKSAAGIQAVFLWSFQSLTEQNWQKNIQPEAWYRRRSFCAWNHRHCRANE